MKNMLGMTALALLVTAAPVSLVLATETPAAENNAVCVAKQEANAEFLGKAKAAKTAAERRKMLQDALKADPANAICLLEMMMELNLASAGNIEPAAGDADLPNFGATPPAGGENPNQLNTPVNTPANNSPDTNL